MNFSLEKAIKLIRKKFIIILVSAILMSAVMYYYTIKTAVPVYTAYAEIYVHTKDTDGDKASSIGTERSYCATYIEILKTVKFGKVIFDNLSDEFKSMTSPTGIYSSLRITSKNETEVIVIRSYSSNKALAKEIAESASLNANIYLNEKFGVDSVEIVDNVRISGATTVSYKKNVIMGFVFGAALMIFIVLIKDLYDHRIRSADEISERYNLPILGTVPTFDSKNNMGKYQSNYKYKHKYRGKHN